MDNYIFFKITITRLMKSYTMKIINSLKIKYTHSLLIIIKIFWNRIFYAGHRYVLVKSDMSTLYDYIFILLWIWKFGSTTLKSD